MLIYYFFSVVPTVYSLFKGSDNSINEENLKLEEISWQLLPGIVKKLHIPFRSDSDNLETCDLAQSYSGKNVYAGCYLGSFQCDSTYTHTCDWIFQQNCKCPSLIWNLNIYQCTVENMKVPFKDSTIRYPVGVCKVADWFYSTITISILTVVFLMFQQFMI